MLVENASSRECIFKWNLRFSGGSRKGRASQSTLDCKNWCYSIRMIADVESANRKIVWQILLDEWSVKKGCAKMIPKKLTKGPKENPKNIFSHHSTVHRRIKLAHKCHWMCDETRTFPERNRQSIYISRNEKEYAKLKAMLIVLFPYQRNYHDWMSQKVIRISSNWTEEKNEEKIG